MRTLRVGARETTRLSERRYRLLSYFISIAIIRNPENAALLGESDLLTCDFISAIVFLEQLDYMVSQAIILIWLF